MLVRNNIINTARKYLKNKYRYGANGPDEFDCSSLVQYVFKLNNINLGRTTYQQIKQGKKVSKANAKTGDLVFFLDKKGSPYHVAIYVGNNRIIEAADETRGIRETNLWGSNHQFVDIIKDAETVKKQESVKKKETKTKYRVICGSFIDKANAQKRVNELKKMNMDSFIEVVE